MVFPRTMADHGHHLDDDIVVTITGRVDRRDDDPKFIANGIKRHQTTMGSAALRLSIGSHQVSDLLVAELKGVLENHPGDAEVFLHLDDQVIRLPDSYRVDTTNGLAGELRVILGPDAVLV